MTRLTTWIAATMLVVLATLLGGCDDDPAQPDYPENAVFLQQNVPQKYGDYRLVAINIDEDSGIVVVELPAGGTENLPAKTGETIATKDGELRLDVVAIEPPDGGQDTPGKGTGRIVVTPA